jgi:hypothetical protein
VAPESTRACVPATKPATPAASSPPGSVSAQARSAASIAPGDVHGGPADLGGPHPGGHCAATVDTLGAARHGHCKIAAGELLARVEEEPRAEEVGLERRRLVPGRLACPGHEVARACPPPGADERAGGRKEPLRAQPGIRRERGGTVERAARGEHAAPPLRVRSRGREELRGPLVAALGRRGEVPRPSLRGVRRQRPRERCVRTPAIGRRRAVVGDGAHDGVAEAHGPARDRDDGREAGRLEQAGVETQVDERTCDEGGVQLVVGRGDEQREPLRRGQGVQTRREHRLEAPVSRDGVADRLVPRALGVAERSRELDEGERVPAGRTQQPLAHVARQRAVAALDEALRIVRGERRDLDLGDAGRVERDLVTGTGREDEQDGICAHAPRGEEEGAAGGLVDPVGVVDEAEERRVLGRAGEQAEHGREGRERSRLRRRAERERGAQRGGLDGGEAIEVPQHGPKQRRERGEGQLRLGLDAGRAQDQEAVRSRGERRDDRRLADAGLAAQDDAASAPAARLLEERRQQAELSFPPDQPLVCGRHPNLRRRGYKPVTATRGALPRSLDPPTLTATPRLRRS